MSGGRFRTFCHAAVCRHLPWEPLYDHMDHLKQVCVSHLSQGARTQCRAATHAGVSPAAGSVLGRRRIPTLHQHIGSNRTSQPVLWCLRQVGAQHGLFFWALISSLHLLFRVTFLTSSFLQWLPPFHRVVSIFSAPHCQAPPN